MLYKSQFLSKYFIIMLLQTVIEFGVNILAFIIHRLG